MKKWILAAAILGTVSLQTVSAAPLDFASVSGASMHWDGAGNFTFDNLNTYDFVTTSGLNGNISGTYAIGAVSGTDPQTAPVSGTGTFSVFDGTFTLSGTVDWISIFTFGTSGGLNNGGVINISGITYGGSNAQLLALSSLPTASGNVTFQFQPAHNLDYLKANVAETSYSGSVSPVPEPMTFSLMGVGLLGLGLLRKRLS